jgi:hypothetical protein
MLWKLIKALIVLLVLAGICLVIYAYVGPIVTPADFEPPVGEISQPVTLTVE